MFAGSRVMDALRLTTPGSGAVVRSLLGMLVVAAAALHWGSESAAMWAAAAGAVAGAIALQDTPGRRLPVMVIASLEMGAAVLLGSLTSSHSAVFVAVVGLWCFAAGMQWALGANAGFVAAAASALLVIAPPDVPTAASVVTATVLTLVAGLVQAALIALWPPRRWRSQRDALTRAHRSLAAEARTMSTDRDAVTDESELGWLRDTLADAQTNHGPKSYHGGFRLPERITATLHALRTVPAGDSDERIAALLAASGEFLEALAEYTRNSHRDVGQALARVDAAAAEVTGPATATAQRLRQHLHEAAALRFGRLRGPDLPGTLASAVTAIRAQLVWTSPVLRHATRLAIAAAVAIAVARFADVADGYWIAVTVLLVLRPETAHTYTRCAGRLAGILTGILVASAVGLVWQPTGLAAIVCAVAFLGLTYAVAGIGYIAMNASLAAAIVFMVGVGGAAIEERVFAAALGGGLAVLAHVALPDHAMIRLSQRAGELLMTEIDYAAAVIKAFVHELDRPADALSAAWQRAFRARAAFEAASGTTRMESRELRRWLRSYRTALNAVTSACTTLEKSLPTAPSTPLDRQFIAAIDDYVDALRGAPPNPAAAWTVDVAELTAAHQHVREVALLRAADNGSARVLVAELATITRSLSGITVDAQELSPGPPG